MLYDAKNGSVAIADTCMDYIAFGTGDRNLVMLPGLGDGLKTVRGMALPFALMYRKFAKRFRVYVFSRRRALPEGFASRDMAADVAYAMEALGVGRADVLGVSQGGTIAQYLAIDHPERVDRLVLAVSYARQNDTVQAVIGKWMEFAETDAYGPLMADMAERIYSEKDLKKRRWLYPILTRVGKPKSFERFLVMAKACLTHDAYEALPRLTCPTLVIGGREDRVVTAGASEELAAAIRGSELYLYEGLGHGAYEEAKDFNQRVIAFLTK